MTEINTGTFTIDFKFRPKDRAGAMVGGRIKMGPHDCLVRPQDIELRTIKSLMVTPIGTRVTEVGSYAGYRAMVLTTYLGSLGVLDASGTPTTPLGNYARIRAAMLGSFEEPTVGTTRVGSAVVGSILASFVAFGD